MRENTLMTKSKVMECLPGQTEDNTTANGSTVSKKELVFTTMLRES
jgi:hypothetical protein